MSSTRYEDLIDNAALNALSRSQLAACRAGEAIPADDCVDGGSQRARWSAALSRQDGAP